MALTDAAVRAAKAQEKDYKLSDSGGLYLYVTTKGAKRWRMKYRLGGKEQRLSFGAYPEISLATARERRDETRLQLRRHQNPAIEKRKAKIAAAAARGQTFEKIALEWHEMQKERWAPVHAADVLQSLKRDVFPEIGDMPLKDIDAPTILAMLRKIEKRGSIETAKRVRQRVSAVFVHAISEGVGDSDPAAVVTKALKPLVKKGRQPALRAIEEARQLIATVDSAGARPWTRMASRLLALTVVRPGIVRFAEWDEFEDLEPRFGIKNGERVQINRPIWRVPAAKMKLVVERKEDDAFEHVVPLAPEAVEVIEAVRRVSGSFQYLFPNDRHFRRPMSENALAYLYKRLGYQGRHVPHGWRSTFSTIMNDIGVTESLGYYEPIIELMLAHVPDNKVKAAYDRATHMERRRELAERWATMLMQGAPPAASLLETARR